MLILIKITERCKFPATGSTMRIVEAYIAANGNLNVSNRIYLAEGIPRHSLKEASLFLESRQFDCLTALQGAVQLSSAEEILKRDGTKLSRLEIYSDRKRLFVCGYTRGEELIGVINPSDDPASYTGVQLPKLMAETLLSFCRERLNIFEEEPARL